MDRVKAGQVKLSHTAKFFRSSRVRIQNVRPDGFQSRIICPHGEENLDSYLYTSVVLYGYVSLP